MFKNGNAVFIHLSYNPNNNNMTNKIWESTNKYKHIVTVCQSQVRCRTSWLMLKSNRADGNITLKNENLCSLSSW